MDEERGFGGVAGCAVRVPVGGYGVALLSRRQLRFHFSSTFLFQEGKRDTYKYHNRGKHHSPDGDEGDTKVDYSSICGSDGET
jgi:hypothetical protein